MFVIQFLEPVYNDFIGPFGTKGSALAWLDQNDRQESHVMHHMVDPSEEMFDEGIFIFAPRVLGDMSTFSSFLKSDWMVICADRAGEGDELVYNKKTDEFTHTIGGIQITDSNPLPRRPYAGAVKLYTVMGKEADAHKKPSG